MKFQELSRENKPPLYLGEDNRWEQAGFPIALFLLVKFHQKSTHIFFAPIPKSPLFFGFFFEADLFLPLVFAESGKSPILSSCFALSGICLNSDDLKIMGCILAAHFKPLFSTSDFSFCLDKPFKKSWSLIING